MEFASGTRPGSPAPHEVAYFRDPFDTLFAAEIVRSHRWDPAYERPPDVSVADIRIVELSSGERPAPPPPWLVIADRALSADIPRLTGLAARAWVYSPHHRSPGAEPAAYVAAGFQALCPPHPACPPGQHSRGALVAFAQHRGGAVGRLANEGRDGFDRWLRVCWPNPSAFARDILLERLRDAGALADIEVMHFIALAEIAPEAPPYADLRAERLALQERLDPLRYFTARAEFDIACAEAERWRARYAAAYEAHYRRVIRTADEVLAETEEARRAAGLLDRWNRQNLGAPVGQEALQRLAATLREIEAFPRHASSEAPQTGRVVLGRAPAVLAEARLAAAAILAAVDVHRRRVTAV